MRRRRLGEMLIASGLLAAISAWATDLHNAGPAAPPAGLSAQIAGPALVDLTGDCLGGVIQGAMIGNGTVSVGVNCQGHLNTPFPGDPLGIGYLGLRYVPTGAASTEPGCRCEGWGIANGAKTGSKVSTCAGGGEEGQANRDVGGVQNLIVESFNASATTAVSVVRVNNGSDLWRVTHDYHPSAATPNLYEVLVTIENLSGVAKPTLYRRVMDWDVYPTPFDEFVTLNPGLFAPTAKLYRMDNNGFNAGTPCSFSSYGVTLEPGEPQTTDAGPADHGALFDFDFGTLTAAGASSRVTFKTYYGATADEAGALTVVALVGAENFSFGQPDVSNGDPTHGTPNTFIFAFAGVGAPAVFCGNGTVDPGEGCDDGNTTSCDGCDSNCQVSGCGNSVVCPPEQCDDGNANGADDCRNDCTVPECGDGMIDPQNDETCDPPGGTAPSGGLCRVDCTSCGDSVLDAGEACDDGNLTNGDGCESDCTVTPACGDGILGNTPGEECDPPGSVSCPPGAPSEAFIVCNSDCTCPECSLDEHCDDGNACTVDRCESGICQHDPNPNPPLEQCANMADDDCDLLIDCNDPDCGVVGGVPICEGGSLDGGSCATSTDQAACENGGGVCRCGPIKKDPSIIRFGIPGVTPDLFKSHGRVEPGVSVDVGAATVGWVVTNGAGEVVYRGVLLPGDLEANRDGTIFTYSDPDAKLGNGRRSGIYKAKIRITRGGTSYGYKVQAYGDMSKATDPNMALQFYLADPMRSFIHDEPWLQRSWGWKATPFE